LLLILIGLNDPIKSKRGQAIAKKISDKVIVKVDKIKKTWILLWNFGTGHL